MDFGFPSSVFLFVFNKYKIYFFNNDVKIHKLLMTLIRKNNPEGTDYIRNLKEDKGSCFWTFLLILPAESH